MNVVPIQTPPQEGAQAKCPNCDAAIVADQRYCLSCGQPCSPVRLAFLDVLQAEAEARAPVTIASSPAGYLPPLDQDQGALGWLRHYSGLFGLLAVLLVTGLIGLLVGHWLSPAKASGPQVLKIEGGVLPAAVANPSSTTSTASTPTPTASKAAASKGTPVTEAQEIKEAKTLKVKPKAPVKTSASSLKSLEKLSGKQHQKAIEKLTEGDKPIETGG